MKIYNKKLKNRSRILRKNLTDAERLLWSKIRKKQIKGLQFYRQKPIGNYIVDFYCHAANLVIEVDGGQHYKESGRKRDAIRDHYLETMGLAVLRFSDVDVLTNMEGVIQRICELLNEKNPPKSPFKKGG